MYKYIELAELLEDRFNNKNYKKGHKLDSIRRICLEFGCHTTTAIKAMNVLKEKGIIYSIPQSGYYLVGQSTYTATKKENYDFASASPDPNLFPYMDYQKCINQAIDVNQENLFKYADIEGYIPLRKSIVKFLTNDNIFTNTDLTVITSGVQQGLDIVTSCLKLNGRKRILIEEPTYHRYIDYLKEKEFEVETIKRTFDGIDLIDLENKFMNGDIRLFYLMPRVHNPLGTKLSKVQKQRIVELAYQYNVYLVEDDYMADYVQDYDNEPLISFDQKKTHVIYLRSFSKVLFPGLRVGFAVLPKTIVEDFKKAKYYNDMGTSLLSQASLEIFMNNKMYERQVSRMQRIYSKRAKLLRQVIRDYCPSGKFDESTNDAIHTCVISEKELDLSKLNKESISILDIDCYYYYKRQTTERYIPINVSNVDVDMIQEGLKKLLSLIYKIK